MRTKWPLLICVFLSGLTKTVCGQVTDVNMDPATVYNRNVIQTNQTQYTRVSIYKVLGSQYLFGEKNAGKVFAKNEDNGPVFISYDTYRQEVRHFKDANTTMGSLRVPGELDSFLVRSNPGFGIQNDMLFVYATLVDKKDKAYYQVIARGAKISLYKKYYTQLVISATNFDPDLREFDLQIEYHYMLPGKGLKKLKLGTNSLIKEFESIKDISKFVIADNLKVNMEAELIRIMEELNK